MLKLQRSYCCLWGQLWKPTICTDLLCGLFRVPMDQRLRMQREEYASYCLQQEWSQPVSILRTGMTMISRTSAERSSESTCWSCIQTPTCFWESLSSRRPMREQDCPRNWSPTCCMSRAWRWTGPTLLDSQCSFTFHSPEKKTVGTGKVGVFVTVLTWRQRESRTVFRGNGFWSDLFGHKPDLPKLQCCAAKGQFLG